MTDEEFLKMLIRHEGKKNYAYQDSEGYWTIGVGRLIDNRKGGRVSDEEIMDMLRNDVNKCVNELDTSIPWWRTLSPSRQAVLTNMCFNLGLKGLLGFKNTLEMVRTGQYDKASKGMLASKWAKQVGNRSIELAEMMKNG